MAIKSQIQLRYVDLYFDQGNHGPNVVSKTCAEDINSLIHLFMIIIRPSYTDTCINWVHNLQLPMYNEGVGVAVIYIDIDRPIALALISIYNSIMHATRTLISQVLQCSQPSGMYIHLSTFRPMLLIYILFISSTWSLHSRSPQQLPLRNLRCPNLLRNCQIFFSLDHLATSFIASTISYLICSTACILISTSSQFSSLNPRNSIAPL